MNINEVYTLSDNLREFYDIYEDPLLPVQIESLRWYISKGIITKTPYSYTAQQLSENLFYWVKE